MLSIIVTVYNQQSTILRTLESVVKSIKSKYEIIIIDDGSTDDSFKLYSQFSNDHKNIFYYRIKNSGVSNARNLGIKKSSFEYLLFLDGDDLLKSDVVESINKNELKNENTDLIVFAYEKYENGIITTNRPINLNKFEFTVIQLFMKINTDKNTRLRMWNSSVVYKKKLLLDNKIYYSPNIHPGEDTEFQLKSLMMAKTVNIVQTTISRYMIHSGTTMTRFNIKRIDAFYAIGNLINFIEEKKNQFSIKQQKQLTKIQNEYRVKRINGFIYNYSYNYFSSKISIKKLDGLISNNYSNIFSEIIKSIFWLLIKNISVKSKLKLLLFLLFFINKKLVLKYYFIKFNL